MPLFLGLELLQSVGGCWNEALPRRDQLRRGRELGRNSRLVAQTAVARRGWLDAGVARREIVFWQRLTFNNTRGRGLGVNEVD